MLFEERKKYISPIITIEKFDTEEILSLSYTGNEEDKSYDVEESPGWLPGWW